MTPYIHIMAKHVPDQVARLNGIKRFTEQCKIQSFIHMLNIRLLHYVALKKNNDAWKNFHSSNHLDGAREILVTNARLKLLAEFASRKRPYNKKWGLLGKGHYEKRHRNDDRLISTIFPSTTLFYSSCTFTHNLFLLLLLFFQLLFPLPS